LGWSTGFRTRPRIADRIGIVLSYTEQSLSERIAPRKRPLLAAALDAGSKGRYDGSI